MMPSISPTDQYPLIYIPLLFVLVLNALRDFIEEAKRKKKDFDINHRPVSVYQRSGAFEQRHQQDLLVGDLVQVKKNEAFPADLLLLASSDKGTRGSPGCCYIETKDLDGETYFKRKEIPQSLLAASASIRDILADASSQVASEAPDQDLYHYLGLLRSASLAEPVIFDNNHFLLAGASLKNTDWVFGLVVYTG
jgi:phospholipid-transporting ATPase